MWVFTPFGFFSIVQKPYDPAGILTVRARVRGDLDAFSQRIARYFTTGRPEPIKEDARADYRFRMRVPASVVALVMSAAVTDIRYDNFKAEVKRRQGADRAMVYGSVWLEMLRLQRPELAQLDPVEEEELRAAAAQLSEEDDAGGWFDVVDAGEAEDAAEVDR